MREPEFLPEWIRQQRRRRRRILRQTYLVVACVAAMCLLTYVRQGRIARARADLAMVERCAQNVRRQVTMIGQLQSQMSRLLVRKRIVEELGSRTDCTAVLAELCRLLPPNMALVSLELKTVDLNVQPGESDRRGGGASARTSARAQAKASMEAVRRVRLSLTGLAPTDVDVANFIGQLSASPLFEDVNMGYAKTVEYRGRTAREFQASCYLAR